MRNASYLKLCTFLFQKQQKHDIKNKKKHLKIKKHKKTCFLNFHKNIKHVFLSMSIISL